MSGREGEFGPVAAGQAPGFRAAVAAEQARGRAVGGQDLAAPAQDHQAVGHVVQELGLELLQAHQALGLFPAAQVGEGQGPEHHGGQEHVAGLDERGAAVLVELGQVALGVEPDHEIHGRRARGAVGVAVTAAAHAHAGSHAHARAHAHAGSHARAGARARRTGREIAEQGQGGPGLEPGEQDAVVADARQAEPEAVALQGVQGLVGQAGLVLLGVRGRGQEQAAVRAVDSGEDDVLGGGEFLEHLLDERAGRAGHVGILAQAAHGPGQVALGPGQDGPAREDHVLVHDVALPLDALPGEEQAAQAQEDQGQDRGHHGPFFLVRAADFHAVSRGAPPADHARPGRALSTADPAQRAARDHPGPPRRVPVDVNLRLKPSRRWGSRPDRSPCPDPCRGPCRGPCRRSRPRPCRGRSPCRGRTSRRSPWTAR